MPSAQNGPAPEEIHLFWLVDCSGSMTGEKMDALNSAAKTFLSRRKEPAPGEAGPRLLLQVLCFSDRVAWTAPSPVEIRDFVWKDPVPGGATQLGPALDLLSDRLAALSAAGPPCPAAVLLFSDGWPSDDYRGPLKRFLSSPWGERSARAAVAIGPEADRDALEEFAGAGERVFRNEGPSSLKEDLLAALHAALEMAREGRGLSDPEPEPEPEPAPPPGPEPLPGLGELLGEGTLGECIAAFERLNGPELPPELSETLGALLQNLRALESLLDQGRIDEAETERFLTFYIPGGIELLLSYCGYQRSGAPAPILEGLLKKTADSLDTLAASVEGKLKSVYRYEMMDTAAKAEALRQLMRQDGYSQNGQILEH